MIQKKGVGMVVYTGDELLPVKLFNVASRAVAEELSGGEKLIFVIALLLPAVVAPRSPSNRKTQLLEVPERETLPS